MNGTGGVSSGGGRVSQSKTTDIIAELGFVDEIARLRAVIDNWIGQASREMRPLLEWQFVGKSKYFRPVTIFRCYRAVSNDRIPESIIRPAAVREMMHKVCSGTRTRLGWDGEG